jgi:hypothetical protein
MGNARDGSSRFLNCHQLGLSESAVASGRHFRLAVPFLAVAFLMISGEFHFPMGNAQFRPTIHRRNIA